MKNKHFDNLRLQSKKYARDWEHRHHGTLTPLGNKIMHSYEDPRDFGWWDDVQFKHGSRVVSVWWTHPRMAFADKTDEIARELMRPAPSINMFEGGVKNYKSLGKNKKRKRHISTTLVDRSTNPSFQDYTDWTIEFDNLLQDVRNTTDLAITPSIKIVQHEWCRGVHLCMPIEAVDKESLEQVAEISKQLLSGSCTLESLFRDYAYTKENWAHDRSVSTMPDTFK